MTEADADRVVDLRALAFGLQQSSRERSRADVLASEYRVAEDAGIVLGCARIIRFGHWFGGRAVPAAGIASVAVAAEARGKGIGRALMEGVIRELRADGIPISSLYPATAVLYRQVGYGFGGTRTKWTAGLRDLRVDGGVALEPFDEEQIAEIEPVYDRIAARANGLVQRPLEMWRARVLRSAWDDEPQYRYLVREDGEVTGWIVYRTERPRDEWRFEMACRDLHWTTPGAGRALLALGSLHRSTGARMTWYGPPVEPLADLVPEEVVELDHGYRWMVRLLDVPGAFEARGYASHLEMGVSIAVRDPLLGDNAGPWRIEVAGGRAKVAPSEDADAWASVGTWASIWSGLYRAHDAVRAGQLDATPGAIEALEAIFTGPLPWNADFY